MFSSTGGDRIAELVRAKDEALIHEDFHRYDEVTAYSRSGGGRTFCGENFIELPHRFLGLPYVLPTWIFDVPFLIIVDFFIGWVGL